MIIMELRNIFLLIIAIILVIILVVVITVAYFAITYGYDLINILQNTINGDINPFDILNFYLNQENVNPEDILNYINQSNVNSDDVINYINQS